METLLAELSTGMLRKKKKSVQIQGKIKKGMKNQRKL
jgi:hypothetical protein